MQIARTISCNKIAIKMPRWKQRVIGIASFRVGDHNEIEILAADKKGKRYYPDKYYMSGEQIRSYDIQVLPSGIKLYLIPISDLEILERV